MKKLTKSVLAVVLTASFTVSYAQKSKAKVDTAGTKDIKEVIITGALGIKKKQDAVTSAVQQVSAEKLNQASNPDAVRALVGKVSGLQVNQTNSSVSGSNSIVLRGKRSITGNNEALIVIDNVISSASVFQQLPPEIIESINVLKGAQGAALYGSDGINGAIIVTTKKGNKSNKFNVTYTSAADFETVAYLPERQKEYGQGWDGDRISVENGAWGPAFNDPNIGGTLLPYGIPLYDFDGDGIVTVNPFDSGDVADNAAAIKSLYAPYGSNNVKDFFKVGTVFQNGVSANIGGENSYMLLSLNNVYRDFVVDKDRLNRNSVLFKGGINYGKWNFEGSFNYINQRTSETNPELYHDILQSSVDIPIEKFKLLSNLPYSWNIYYGNPYWNIENERNNSVNNFFNIQAGVGFKINEHIDLKYTGNIQTNTTEGRRYNNGWNDTLFYDDYLTAIGSYYFQNNFTNWRTYNDLLANFDYDLSESLNLKLNLGANYQERKRSNTTGGGTGIIIPGIYQIWNIQNPSLPYNLDNISRRLNGFSVLGNLDLAYKDYLFFNATARNEWWSNLPVQNRSYFYPSFGISFVPTKAFDGLKGDVLNYLKLNAAWQKTGNSSSVLEYDVYDRPELAYGFPYGSDLSFQIDRTQTNQNIRPEFTTKKEVGATLGFLKDRITLTGAVFQEDTKDMITRQSTSSSSGLTSNLVNIGALENKGFEVDLGLVPFKSRDFGWEINMSYYKSKTVVTKVTDDADEVRLTGNTIAGIFAVKGEEFGTIKGSAYLRDDLGRIIIDQSTGNPLYSTEFVKLGKTTPDYILSLNTNINIYRFKLGAVMDYRAGSQFYSQTKQSMAFQGTLVESAGFDRTQGGYVIPNSVYQDTNGNYVENTNIKSGGNDYATLTTYFGGVYARIGENFVIDGDAFKVRELSLSYDVPVKNSGLTGLVIGVHARNPFVKLAKNNRGYNDPETSFTNGNAQGFADDNQYPNLKTYGVSVKVNF